MRCIGLIALLTALVVCGCGGGGPDAGRATLTLRWPERSRLIPFAANSIRVDVSRNGQGLGTALLVRPAGGGNATATFDRLPIGDATVSATALPNADGTGVAQAGASVPVTIVAGQTASVRLTLASAIGSLSVSPSAPSLSVGGTVNLSVTPKNAAGETVLVAPATLTYTTNNAAAATIDGFGKVTARGAGSANITVTETESGKQATVVVTVSTGTGGSPNSSFAFGSPNVYALPGSGPVAAADMDGDGKVDVVGSGQGDIAIFYGHGDGTLDAASAVFHRIDGVWLSDVQDMDGDGRPDIVCLDGLSKIHVLINRGNRQFAPPKTLYVTGFTTIAVADVNGDQRPDCLGLNSGSGAGGEFVVMLNQGDGSQVFSGNSYGLPFIPEGLHPCDANGDGKVDVLTSYGANVIDRSGIRIYLGDGHGKFLEVGSASAGTGNCPNPTSGDFDRDGKLDFVQSNYGAGGLIVYRGDGAGDLGDRMPYTAEPYPYTLRAVDVNHDGWLDIFTANAGSTHASILLNQGGGVFADRVFVESGGNNIRFGAVADLTGDGKPELILSAETSGTISVLVNQTP